MYINNLCDYRAFKFFFIKRHTSSGCTRITEQVLLDSSAYDEFMITNNKINEDIQKKLEIE